MATRTNVYDIMALGNSAGVNRMTYTRDQLAKAQTALDIMSMTYTSESYHVKYNKQSITIKLFKPVCVDKKKLKDVDAMFAERKYKKENGKGYVVYHLPKSSL